MKRLFTCLSLIFILSLLAACGEAEPALLETASTEPLTVYSTPSNTPQVVCTQQCA